MIGQYAKAVVAVLLAAAMDAQTVMATNGHISPQGWVSIIISALIAAGVWLVPNSSPPPPIAILSEPNEKLVS